LDRVTELVSVPPAAMPPKLAITLPAASWAVADFRVPDSAAELVPSAWLAMSSAAPIGPVVVAAPFQSIDEIAAQANDSEYGLGAGIWTKDISKAHALAKKLRAGTVWINCYNVFDAALPFGGYKQSGWGREMGAEALELYTETKSVVTLL